VRARLFRLGRGGACALASSPLAPHAPARPEAGPSVP
jgi:hypothetical protein